MSGPVRSGGSGPGSGPHPAGFAIGARPCRPRHPPGRLRIPPQPLIMRGGPLVVLPRETFARSAVEVAPALLGCVLEHETPEGLVAVALTEVEAYHGQADPASHAYRGRTARNAVMFGEPGHAYVYFTYGMHFCVNLVCLPQGTASAVLLRAGRVTDGVALAAARRMAGRNGARQVAENDLARGPARLCQALGIDRSFDGADVCDPASELRTLPSVLAGSGPEGPR